MSDSIQGEETFAFTFPVWLIREPGIKIEGIKFAAAAGGVALPIFTDRDLAQTLLDSAPNPAAYVLEPLSELAFFGLIVLLEQRGVTHVLVDPSPGKTKSDAFAVSVVREYAAKWFD